MTLRSHASNAVESDGNVSGEATTSAAIVPEQSGPGIPRNLLVDASNPLPHGAGTLPHENEALGNNLDGAAAQAGNLGVLNRAPLMEITSWRILHTTWCSRGTVSILTMEIMSFCLTRSICHTLCKQLVQAETKMKI